MAESPAARLTAKFTHIALDRGDTPSQPMLTVRGSGTLEDMHRLADGRRADLAAAGLRGAPGQGRGRAGERGRARVRPGRL